MTERPRQDRLGEVEAPAAVGGQRRVEGLQPAVGVEAHPPLRVEAVPLARHRHVLVAGETQPDRAAGEDRTEGGDRREPVRLHLLAAEAATHPQTLDGDVVAVEPEDVRHDLLGLARVLGAALDEDLPRLVDEGEGGMGLEVEVLLPGEVQLAAEDVLGPGQGRLDVAALHLRLAALEALRRDRLTHGDQRGEGLVVHLHGDGAEPGRLERLAEDPAHGVPVEHHLVGEQRLVVLDARVVDARHVGRREHPDHAGHGERRPDVQAGDPGVRVERLDGVGVQDVLRADHEVVGVERLTGDVEEGTLVRKGLADNGARGSLGQCTHAPTSSCWTR